MNVTFENGSPHHLRFSCSSCHAELSISMDVPPKTVFNTQKITFQSPCPQCGAEISGVGGRYEACDGELVRVGDYDGEFKDGGNLGE